MPTLAWATDIHLDFATPSRIDALVARLATDGPDGVVLSGDLSNAGALTRHLALLADRLARPIYFVLGNHDYYGSSIAAVLCGHTHSAGTTDLLPNLRVLTGAAVYRAPAAQPPLVL